MRLWISVVILLALLAGASAHAASAPLRLSPGHRNFGNVPGGTGVTQDTTLLNTSDGDILISNADISYTCGVCGEFPPLFTVAGDCAGTTLSSGATCTVTVAFNPPAGASPDRYTGTVCIQYPDPADPTALAETCADYVGRGT